MIVGLDGSELPNMRQDLQCTHLEPGLAVLHLAVLHLQCSVPSVTLCGKLLTTVVGVSCIHFARLAAHDGNVTIVFVIRLLCMPAG
jgi:hypothetical protein